MNPAKSEETIFAAAVELPPDERAAYLERACAGDEVLQRQVESLLQAHDDATTNFLEKSPTALTAAEPGSGLLREKAGDRIGRYKLLQQIGEGGCGVVYMAEQTEPVRRQVALKVIKLGMDTKSVIARFEAERQALALMDHPNIAKVLDAGATETGRPYFVMELVRGVKITEFCDKNNLPTRERLNLFIQVCQAIQHAHQKGIIHRDIKPSNILVTLNDGVPLPKVIDFGIAKATQERLTDKTLFTAFEQFLGTPAYMSPEQAEMSAQGVDTRSDIYSLGVLLYELLTGHTPFDTQELLRAGVNEIRRIIREEEPMRPSTKLSTLLEGELMTTANFRRTDPPKLIQMVRGDLDWIVMKALEKDRARRYETANGFARDVAHYLDGEPVSAHPPGTIYQFNKMVRRHKFAFALAASVAMALMIGFIVSSYLLAQERKARHEAQIQAAQSKQVAQFLEAMLNGVQPSVAAGRDTTVLKAILDKTSERVGKDLTNQPEVEAELSQTLGQVYWALGDLNEAETMDRQALELQRKSYGDDSAQTAGSMSDLGMVIWRRGGLTNAEAMLRQALAIQQETLGTNSLEAAKTLDNLAGVLNTESRVSSAEAALREELAIKRGKLGDTNTEVAGTLSSLAAVLTRERNLGEAEDDARAALSIQTNQLGNVHPDVAASLNVLAQIRERKGEYADSEKLYRQVLAMCQKLYGNEHPQTALALFNLGRVLGVERDDEAEPMMRQALAMQKKTLGDDNAEVATTAEQFGVVLTREGIDSGKMQKLSEAESVLRENVERSRRVYGSKDGPVALELFYLGHALYYEGKLTNAETALKAAIELRKRLNPAHPSAGDSLDVLGDIYSKEQRYSDAAKAYRESADQGSLMAYRSLGKLYARGAGVTKDDAEAVKLYQKGVEMKLWCAYADLGYMYQTGRGVPQDIARAIELYQQGADTNNQIVDTKAEEYLAWLMATSPDASIRNGTQAVALAEMAIEWAGLKDPELLDTLAAAYAETGKFAKAAQTEEEAIAAADEAKTSSPYKWTNDLPLTERSIVANELRQSNLISQFPNHLRLYQSGTPRRENPASIFDY